MTKKTNKEADAIRPVLHRDGDAVIDTEYGEFRFIGYRSDDGKEHLAICKGELRQVGVLCRVHSECLTGEVFGSRKCECGSQLDVAMRLIQDEGTGVIVYLRQEGRGIGLINKLKAYRLQNNGADTVDANAALGFSDDLRRYDIAATILDNLGVMSVRLLSNNLDKVDQLANAGITILERLPHIVGIHDGNRAYIETKRERMRHEIADSDIE